MQAKSVDVAVSHRMVLIFYVNTFVSLRERKSSDKRESGLDSTRSLTRVTDKSHFTAELYRIEMDVDVIGEENTGEKTRGGGE